MTVVPSARSGSPAGTGFGSAAKTGFAPDAFSAESRCAWPHEVSDKHKATNARETDARNIFGSLGGQWRKRSVGISAGNENFRDQTAGAIICVEPEFILASGCYPACLCATSRAAGKKVLGAGILRDIHLTRFACERCPTNLCSAKPCACWHGIRFSGNCRSSFYRGYFDCFCRNCILARVEPKLTVCPRFNSIQHLKTRSSAGENCLGATIHCYCHTTL